MSRPRDYQTKWTKPVRERQISYDITYCGILKKKIQINISKTKIDSKDIGNKHPYKRRNGEWAEVGININTPRK